MKTAAHISILTLAAALIWAAALPARTAEPAIRPPVLERRLSIDLWGSNLNEAVRALMEASGVEIVFYRPDFPASQAGPHLYLVSGDISLRTALECLGRRFGFRYRLSESGRVELSKGYGWVNDDDFAVRFPRIDPLAGSESAESLRNLLAELAKPLPLLADSFSLSVSRTPNPDGTETVKAEAVLPPVLGDYFDKAIACLTGDSGDTGAGPAVAHQSRLNLAAFLSRDLRLPVEADIRAALLGIARQANLALMLETRPAAAVASPFVALHGGRATVGQALAELSARLGFGRRVVLADGAVSLESGGGDDWERDDRSRELFWTGLTVAGFDARGAAEAAGNGPALAARLRSQVFPRLWRDPAAAVAYSPVTGRLVVIAPANVVEAAGEWLRRVME